MFVKDKRTNLVYFAVQKRSRESKTAKPARLSTPGFELHGGQEGVLKQFWIPAYKLGSDYKVLTDTEVFNAYEIISYFNEFGFDLDTPGIELPLVLTIVDQTIPSDTLTPEFSFTFNTALDSTSHAMIRVVGEEAATALASTVDGATLTASPVLPLEDDTQYEILIIAIEDGVPSNSVMLSREVHIIVT